MIDATKMTNTELAFFAELARDELEKAWGTEDRCAALEEIMRRLRNDGTTSDTLRARISELEEEREKVWSYIGCPTTLDADAAIERFSRHGERSRRLAAVEDENIRLRGENLELRNILRSYREDHGYGFALPEPIPSKPTPFTRRNQE